MFGVLRSIASASLASAMLAGTVHAQAQAGFSRAPVKSSTTVQRSVRGPSLTLYGGLATGDNGFDMGPALAASFNWNLPSAPFNVRLDPYFAFHSADDDGADAKLWLLGATGNLELAFRPTGTTAEPYIFGGAGFYYRNFSIDTGDEDDFDDSDMKGAFDFGGGVRFGGFTLEAKLQDIDEFTNVSFLVGFRLGG